MSKFKNSTATATEQAAAIRMNSSMAIMQMAGITSEEWLHVVFEIGCIFIEKNKQIPYLHQALLQNERLGYWDWWLTIFTEDDAFLLNMGMVKDYKNYYRDKLAIAYCEPFENQFKHYLTRLAKRNEI